MAGRFLDPSSVPLKQQSGGNIWSTLVYITQGLTLAAGLAVIMLFFLPVIQKQQNLLKEKDRLQREISAAQEQQQQLKMQTEHMKNNPAYVEHIARDRLNMGRAGETVIRFDPYTASPSTSRPVGASN